MEALGAWQRPSQQFVAGLFVFTVHDLLTSSKTCAASLLKVRQVSGIDQDPCSPLDAGQTQLFDLFGQGRYRFCDHVYYWLGDPILGDFTLCAV